MECVELKDDTFLCQTCNGWRDTSCCREIDLAVIFDCTDFDDCIVYITEETVTKILSHHTEVNVVVGNLTCINMLAEIRVSGVRGTILDGMLVGEHTVS